MSYVQTNPNTACFWVADIVGCWMLVGLGIHKLETKYLNKNQELIWRKINFWVKTISHFARVNSSVTSLHFAKLCDSSVIKSLIFQKSWFGLQLSKGKSFFYFSNWRTVSLNLDFSLHNATHPAQLLLFPKCSDSFALVTSSTWVTFSKENIFSLTEEQWVDK